MSLAECQDFVLSVGSFDHAPSQRDGRYLVHALCQAESEYLHAQDIAVEGQNYAGSDPVISTLSEFDLSSAERAGFGVGIKPRHSTRRTATNIFF